MGVCLGQPGRSGTEVEEKGVVYTTIAHGPWLERTTLIVLLATALLLLGVLVQKRLREGRLPLVTPLVALLSSIWSWSIYSSIDPLVMYVIPALHSVQYLYFVWLLRGNEAREREGPPWFEAPWRVRLGTLALGASGSGGCSFTGRPRRSTTCSSRGALASRGPRSGRRRTSPPSIRS